VDSTCIVQFVTTTANQVHRLAFAHSPRPGVVDNAVEV
jgi:hypothetical protein